MGKRWGNALGGWKYQKRTKKGTFAGLGLRGKTRKGVKKVKGSLRRKRR
ncbi:hypothetical protein BI084_gp05 [Gordonia phage Terapin]|uniref:Uncharacterized protein n=6 Tax=Terapinvirus TaxID=2733216 RepID=A0A2Z4Q7V1_9CAUD|nr:hypothetical protein BI084_gp05 [Gordonia phage Terapin]YP_009802967.1 hypothetical protein HOT44_gp06 [Gordonia phage Suzy]AVP43282.1 hypothetical protein PBI_DJOKOVIC_5 [Gordonia phage Djokovic]AXH67716.1 hypothetical protein SEA_BEYONCAGE_5 [Gordonia phage Beyoncage]QOC56150.1 hypothetical protein SEA_SIENNA_5 [Gordonia phage Sienna]QOC56575.1 hypothetical protein SEA_BITESIZE_5 [Gordonia phage BiteSize]QYW00808.1 hypothetical protein SEA_MADI_5 [Gordonia phage Madi]